jgi:hypothetical protein
MSHLEGQHTDNSPAVGSALWCNACLAWRKIYDWMFALEVCLSINLHFHIHHTNVNIYITEFSKCPAMHIYWFHLLCITAVSTVFKYVHILLVKFEACATRTMHSTVTGEFKHLSLLTSSSCYCWAVLACFGLSLYLFSTSFCRGLIYTQ